MGKDGAWLGAATADIDAADKTWQSMGLSLALKVKLLVKSVFIHKMTNTKSLKHLQWLLRKFEAANSPFTVISNGGIKGDVYVTKSAIGFAAQNGKDVDGKQVTAKIDGNLYFATQDQLDAYNKLDTTAKYDVTGKTEVKAAE